MTVNEEQKNYYKLVKSLPRLEEEEITKLYHEEGIYDMNLFELRLSCDEELKEKVEKKIDDFYDVKSYSDVIKGKKAKDRIYPSVELRNKIVEGNLYIAIYYASIYFHKKENRHTFDELYSYSTEALMSAAYYFVPSDKAKFRTYARKCIENRLKKEVYHEKKMQKRPFKAEYFFEMEEARIFFLESFLNNICVTGNTKGKNLYLYKNQIISKIIYKMSFDVGRFNREKLKEERTDLMLPKMKGMTYDRLLKIFHKMLKESKMDVLITEEEKEDIKALSNNVYNTNNVEIVEAMLLLDLYRYKIQRLKRYVKASNELDKEFTDEELFLKLNSDINTQNKDIRKRKKEGFYDTPISYKSLESFYNKYFEVYDVDIFDRKEEKEEIRSDYYYKGVEPLSDLCETYKKWKSEIENDDSSEFNLYYLNGKEFPIGYSSKKTKVNEYIALWYDECEDSYEVFNKAEMLKKLDTLLKIVESEDSYIKYVLKQKAKHVNELLKKENAPIIEENRKRKEEIRIFREGAKLKKYFNERTFRELKQDISLLYLSDAYLLDVLLKKEDKDKNHYLSVEEEAMDALFIEDYKKALEMLTSIEKEVLELYFSEDGTKNKTEKEISKIIGTSESNVSKIKCKALKKLRENDKIKSYYDAYRKES